MESRVYEDDYGISCCGRCDAELLCDDNGDMPDNCPACGSSLDWSYYESI